MNRGESSVSGMAGVASSIDGDSCGGRPGAGVSGCGSLETGSRLTAAFAGRKAFIPFVTCGDPSIEVTRQLVLGMASAGADLIELGVPFSDPTAEGPVIQAANVRALAGGITTDAVFDMVCDLREQTDVPLALMTYANVLYAYGIERFARRCAQAGIDGVILPDVPLEEKAEFAEPLAREGVCLVSLVAPTSEGRIASIAREAAGFVYCVSSLGVTGVRSQITTDVASMVGLVRDARAKAGKPPLPCAVGFGISSPEQAAAMAAQSDGAIVGSAIVGLVERYGDACVGPVCDYVREMATAVHGVSA